MLGNDEVGSGRRYPVGTAATGECHFDAGIGQIIFNDELANDVTKAFPFERHGQSEPLCGMKKPVKMLLQEKRSIAGKAEKIKNGIAPLDGKIAHRQAGFAFFYEVVVYKNVFHVG